MVADRDLAGGWISGWLWMLFLAAIAIQVASPYLGSSWRRYIAPALKRLVIPDPATQISSFFGGAAVQKDEIAVQRAYVAVLVSAANHSGRMSDKRERTIVRIGERIQGASSNDLNISTIIEDPELKTGSVRGVARFAAALFGQNPSMKTVLACDVCSILFAHGEPIKPDLEWLREFSQITGWGDVAVEIIRFFEQSGESFDRCKWSAELEVPPDADTSTIQRAFRRKAMQYHPDRCGTLPPHIQALAQEKMTAINEAYSKLIDSVLALHFWAEDRSTTLLMPSTEPPAVCVCWICEQKNRLTSSESPANARCANCYALLGLPFDPMRINQATPA